MNLQGMFNLGLLFIGIFSVVPSLKGPSSDSYEQRKKELLRAKKKMSFASSQERAEWRRNIYRRASSSDDSSINTSSASGDSIKGLLPLAPQATQEEFYDHIKKFVNHRFISSYRPASFFVEHIKNSFKQDLEVIKELHARDAEVLEKLNSCQSKLFTIAEKKDVLVWAWLCAHTCDTENRSLNDLYCYYRPICAEYFGRKGILSKTGVSSDCRAALRVVCDFVIPLLVSAYYKLDPDAAESLPIFETSYCEVVFLKVIDSVRKMS